MQVGTGVHVGIVPGNVEHETMDGRGRQQVGKAAVTLELRRQRPDRPIEQRRVPRHMGAALVAGTYYRAAPGLPGPGQSLHDCEPDQRLIT